MSGHQNHHRDAPGVFRSDPGGRRVIFSGIRFSADDVAEMMIFSGGKGRRHVLHDIFFLHRSTFAGVAVSFTSPPGGNKVDGLPPASSFVFFLLVLGLCVFIFSI